MVNKEELYKVFQKDWKKHYQIDALVKKGFQRRQCSNCRKFFWSLDSSKKVCSDSSCMGYEFIGKPTKKLGYVETWKEIEKFFKKKGHTPINRFPVVARWRDDLYFTVASIIDFQPYVVRGELAPPANPLIVPQTCFRFNDIGNVGVTGRHYSCFVMFGQHAFNSGSGKPKYWKDEALEYDFEYLNKVLGAKKEDITFNEDVWAGGGTFGPSMEWMVNGIELGNCVFMQYEETDSGTKQLNTKVVDMGASLERLAWFTNGTPTSYDVTFNPLIQKLKKDSGIQLDEKLFLQYAKISGVLDNEGQNIKAERSLIAKKLGIGEKELFDQLMPLQALYAVCDHTKSILYGITDGQLPSNAGGGYNLRLLLRRIFGFNEEFNLELDYEMIIKEHVKMLKGFDNSIGEIPDTVIDVIAEEQKKYQNLKEVGRKKIQAVVERLKKEDKKLEKPELVTLYESHGIPFELSKEIAEEHGVKVEEIYNFYDSIALKNEKHKEKKAAKTNADVSPYPQTKQMYYDELYKDDFTAKVLGSIENYVILDQTLFYPEGGGQDGDRGMLNGVEVLDTIKQGGVILHLVKDPKPFKKGMKVSGKIDRIRRENLMHNHTCTHVLNAACRELLGEHIWQAGAHKEVEKAHLDITHYKKMTEEEIQKVTKMVNQRVKQQIPVKKFVIDRGKAEQKYGFKIYQGGFVPGKELRLVEIQGVDIQACGGTHINNTKEIGDFAILKVESIQDGIQRISFCTGEYARKQFAEEKSGKALQMEITGLKAMNESKMAELKAKINSISNSSIRESLNKSLKLVADELGKAGDKTAIEGIEKQAEQDIGKNQKIISFFTSASPSQISKASQNIINTHDEIITVIASEPNNLVTIFSGKNSKTNALKILEIAKKLGAKGGGSEVTAQAKFNSKDDINKFFNEIKRLGIQ